MSEKLTTPSTKKLESTTETRLRITDKGRKAIAGLLLLAGAVTGYTAHEVADRLQPETIAEFNVTGGVNSQGNINELQLVLNSELDGTDIDPNSVADVVSTGQQLEDGPNTVHLERNGFGHTWVEIDDTADSTDE